VRGRRVGAPSDGGLMNKIAPHISLTGARRHVLALLVAAAVALSGAAAAPTAHFSEFGRAVRVWTIHYEAHNGSDRLASPLRPASSGPGTTPPLPAVRSPHARGATGLSNSKFFADMPAIGRFALISLDGMGRKLKRFSYGYPGQIDDLARMPDFAEQA